MWTQKGSRQASIRIGGYITILFLYFDADTMAVEFLGAVSSRAGTEEGV